jgi:hypothetical protein
VAGSNSLLSPPAQLTNLPKSEARLSC